ncbi:AAA family ATPase [Crassaminicella indica]|uniref:AAA family ATPase n=1 Tax=Crassaminicella indica TaxID=2855394 RepID=A0ABX8RGE7_9CLOT|nr:AAA family ATPase [Crassaminicella indica]QXM06790.1 AAA family ATPase [Crassaminicella indica]
MSIKKLKLSHFTVFENIDIEFSDGINIFIGENGTGKTHIMKVLYAACQASRKDIMFSQKLVKVFKPDNLNINRLVKRGKGGDTSKIEVYSSNSNIKAKFTTKTKKWEADVIGETTWEKNNSQLISTFIPAKEILANAYQFEAAYLKNMIDFDETYLDIITAAKIDISRGPNTSSKKKYLDQLKKITEGKVTISKEKFYLKPGTQAKIEFNLVAEGLRKLALLWQLIKNGTLEKGTILFWDEPEANLNPIAIPTLVEILLSLQKEGVQIFISTHDYLLSKYFEIRATKDNDMAYYSLYRDEDKNVKVYKCDNFRKLKENPIIKAYDKLMDEVFDSNMGD